MLSCLCRARTMLVRRGLFASCPAEHQPQALDPWRDVSVVNKRKAAPQDGFPVEPFPLRARSGEQRAKMCT